MKSMLIRAGCRILFLLLCLIWLHFRGEAETRRLSEKQAIAIADAFWQRLGRSPGKPVSATYPSPKLYENERDYHWQKRWRIEYPNQVILEIVDQTGVISRFSNGDYFTRVNSGLRSAEKFLTREMATQKVSAILRATSLRGISLEMDEALLHDQSPGRKEASGVFWEFHWRRTFGEYPYADQGVDILLDAQTGELVLLGIRITSAAPLPVRRILSQEAAVQTAGALLNTGKMGSPVLTESLLEVVQIRPETGKAPKPSGEKPQERDWPTVARLAWSLRFEWPDQGFPSYGTFWIDAENGKIIRHSEGRVKVMAVSLSDALREVKEIRLFRTGNWKLSRSTPVAVFSKSSFADTFSALRNASVESNRTGLHVARYRIELVYDEGNGQSSQTLYLTSDGAFGRFGQWATLTEPVLRQIEMVASANQPK